MTGSSSSARLEELVEATGGGQPWRRVFHATNGLLIAGVLGLTPITRLTGLAILSAAFVLLLAVDVLRLTTPRANELFFTAFGRLATPRDADGPASSTWYALGATLAVALFPRELAASGVLVLALADPAASYVGRRWGRRRFLGGTVEGSVTFFLVAAALLLARHATPVALAAAIVTTSLERLSWPLDDNLTIPLVCAGSLSLVGLLG